MSLADVLLRKCQGDGRVGLIGAYMTAFALGLLSLDSHRMCKREKVGREWEGERGKRKQKIDKNMGEGVRGSG